MYCDKCGHQLREGAKFCNKCGNAVIVEKQETYKAINRPINDHAVKPTEKETPRPIASKEPTSSDKGSGLKKILIIAGICCGVLLIGVLVFLLFFNKPKSNDTIYQGYVQILHKSHDEIKAYEKDTGGKSIAIVDMNGSDTDDMVFVTRKKGSGQETEDKPDDITMHYCYDSKGEIKEKELAAGDDFALFMDARTKDLFQYELVPYHEGIKKERVVKLKSDENDVSETDSFSRYCNAETKEISYTDNEHGGEDHTSDKSAYENLKTQDVCVLLSSEDIIDQQQVFDNCSDDLSMNYDEAISKLNGEKVKNDPATSTQQAETQKSAETQKPTEKPVVITDIDPSEIPDGLTEFLQIFDFAYGAQSGGREYDCKELDNIKDKLLSKIVGNPRIVDLEIYPGGDSKSSFTPNSDPLDKYPKGWGYIAVPKEKAIWILEHILNVPENETEAIIQAAMQADPDIYEYEENGTTYLYNKIGGLGGPGYKVTYESIKCDGEKYYFIYDCSDAVQYDGATTVTYYAEMALKEIDGKKYWSIYRHTEDIPDLPKSNDTSDDDPETEWSSIYKNFIMNKNYLSSHEGWLGEGSLRKRIEDDTTYPIFYLYDLNNDKTPELFMSFGYIGGSTPHNVYTVRGNKLEFLSNITPGGNLLIYNPESENHGLFCGTGRQGSYAVQYWYMNGDTLESKAVLSEKAKSPSDFSQGFDLTINDQDLYDTFMDCTKETDHGPAASFRVAKSSLPAHSQSEIESIGWDSYIAEYGY